MLKSHEECVGVRIQVYYWIFGVIFRRSAHNHLPKRLVC